MATIRDLRARFTELLAVSESARLDCDLLLTHVLDRPRTALIAHDEQVADADAEARFDALLRRRSLGEPVAYLVETREFWSLEFRVTPATLIPRADTEVLVEQALGVTGTAPLRVADLGTGSGAVAVALGTERPQWQITATDTSVDALVIARQNAQRHAPDRIEFLQGRWCEPFAQESLDLIVSNPPYVAPGDPHLAALHHEPLSALVAGDDGMADIRELAHGAHRVLRPGGWILFEHGADQGSRARECLEEHDYDGVFTARDVAGHERVSGGRKPGASA